MKSDVETALDTGAREGDGSTRDRVLQLVVEEGPISAAALGRALDLTAAAVRRHLDAMTEQGLVEIKNVSTRRRGAGRPSRRYVISSRGQQALGDDYLNLVKSALSVLDSSSSAGFELREADPRAEGDSQQSEDSGARAVARQYFAEFESKHAAELAEIEDLDERTERLAEALNDAGFAGFTRLAGRDSPLLAMQLTQLCQGHCPIREIASEYPVFCDEETEMIARLLDVDVRRLSTQAAGAHVCTTHVPVGREKLAAQRATHPTTGTQTTAAVSGRKRIVISPRQQERLS